MTEPVCLTCQGDFKSFRVDTGCGLFSKELHYYVNEACARYGLLTMAYSKAPTPSPEPRHERQ